MTSWCEWKIIARGEQQYGKKDEEERNEGGRTGPQLLDEPSGSRRMDPICWFFNSLAALKACLGRIITEML